MSALRWTLIADALALGPEVVKVTVTACAPVVPAAICVGLNAQVTVASGKPPQAKVTASTNFPPTGVRVKVDVVDSPAGAGAGVVGGDKVNGGPTT